MIKTLFYDWGGANAWLFYLVNGWHNDALDAFMQAGSFIGHHERFPVYLAALALCAWVRVVRGDDARRWLGVLAVFALAYVLDGLLIGVLKQAFDFARPLAALPPETIHSVGEPEYRRSFPSGHATFAMMCAASVWPLLGRGARAIAAVLVLWVCLSRISLGAHFPADVAGGAVLALGVVLGVRHTLDASTSLVAKRPVRRRKR